MSIDFISSISSSLPIPDPTSDRPILFWSTLVDTKLSNFEFELNQNITFPTPNNPKKPFSATTCRAINVAVDLTIANGNNIVYMSMSGIPCTYIANYSGIHPIIHLGIISVGDGILSLQSGV